MREEARVFVPRKGGEKMILAGVRRGWHGRSPNQSAKIERAST
jgi:hypothetical protein